jgi:RNA polymerase I-specific transcription initiation factor RRN7
MSGTLEYHKFPHGEHCTSEGCRSRRYYVLDGGRFCKSNGHKQEGYTQIAADEDDFNNQGRKTRRKKDEKERIEIIYSGREATELFLQCWQLILWKQVEWLVRVKQMPEELETVVRDLWSIRLRAVTGLGEDDIVSATERMGDLSSASDRETESDATMSASESGRRKRKRGRIRANGLPKLIDTLGLCYLGMVMLRLPVSLGDLQRWAEKEEIIFLRAVSIPT